MPKKLRSLAEASARHIRTVHGTVPWYVKLREKQPEVMAQVDAWMDELRGVLATGRHPKFHGPKDFADWLIKEIPTVGVGHLAIESYYKKRAADAKNTR